jgi:iron(III) transport system ATP-binding protein
LGLVSVRPDATIVPMGELIIEDLRLRSGKREVLQGVSLTVYAGEIVALVGPAGSGKTSLLRAIAGLEAPHAGSIRIGSNVLFDAANRIDVPAEKRELGFLFQTYALYPHLTVFENIAFGLKLRGLTTTEIAALVNKAISDAGLSHLSARYPRSLSATDRQRVALARSLTFTPAMILMEEPLQGFNEHERAAESAWLKHVIREVGLPALYVTHDRAEARTVADRISILKTGVLKEIPSASPSQSLPPILTADTAEHQEGRDNLIEDQVIDGTIKQLTDFGAFVDLGGTDGFLRSSDIGWRHIDHPSEVLSIG